MDVFEAINTRFACRHFLDRPVDFNTVRALVEGAGRTASSLNLQPWHVYVVTGGALKVRVRAPALEGRANDALREYLAELLKTPKAAVRILSGQHSRSKRVEVRGVTELQILALVTREA